MTLVEWIYPRSEGDIAVFAKSASEAIAIIRLHGFPVLRPETVRRGESTFTQRLKSNPID